MPLRQYDLPALKGVDVMTATHETYMSQALKLAESALAQNEFPVGCVIVFNHMIVGSGYRRHTLADTENEIDHAEILAIKSLPQTPEKMPRSEMTIYSTMEPCLMCYAAILISGIKHIVYAYEDAMGGGLDCDLGRLRPLYRQMDIRITPHVLRQESLALFKSFFMRPENTYLEGSLLEKYTLDQ